MHDILSRLRQPLRNLSLGNVRRFAWLADALRRTECSGTKRGGEQALRRLRRLDVLWHSRNPVPNEFVDVNTSLQAEAHPVILHSRPR